MKKISIFGLSAVAMMSVACGGGDSGGVTATTGTGYYVDSAVFGVSYECGTQKGVTDVEGKFIYDINQGCTFSLAGVTLRNTSASNLVNGGKIVENNPTVARFLQSLDNDGDASNGIQITDEVIAILTEALANANSAGKVPSGDEVDSVVSIIETSVASYQGRVKTPAEVAEHLENTQTEVAKALVAGKTFYSVERNEGGVYSLNRVTFNSDATLVTFTRIKSSDGDTTPTDYNGPISVEISGENVRLQDEQDFYKVSNTTEAILLDGEPVLYRTQAKAQAAYDERVANSANDAINIAGTYNQNGTTITIDAGGANMDGSTPPIFQFNFKHNVGDYRDMVQISTIYESKDAFDNAFSANTLVLSTSNNNLRGVGMEIAGLGWVESNALSADFKATVTKNSNGSYSLSTVGSYSVTPISPNISQDRTISSINVTNILFEIGD